jgi:ABC-type uncharacterized transport system permease subunit
MTVSTSVWNEPQHNDRSDDLRLWELGKEERRDTLLRMATDLIDVSTRDPDLRADLQHLFEMSGAHRVSRIVAALEYVASQQDNALTRLETSTPFVIAAAMIPLVVYVSLPLGVVQAMDSTVTPFFWSLFSNIALAFCGIISLWMVRKSPGSDRQVRRRARAAWAAELTALLLRELE